MQEKRFFEMERSHEDWMKAYEEQIYALTQELKMRRRELEKIETIKLDVESKLAKALSNEKSVL